MSPALTQEYDVPLKFDHSVNNVKHGANNKRQRQPHVPNVKSRGTGNKAKWPNLLTVNPETLFVQDDSSVEPFDVNNSMMALTVFKCTICSKNFKKKEYLRDHLNIHAGRRCYACNYCGQSFIHRASMARHRLKCHLSPQNQPMSGGDPFSHE